MGAKDYVVSPTLKPPKQPPAATFTDEELSTLLAALDAYCTMLDNTPVPCKALLNARDAEQCRACDIAHKFDRVLETFELSKVL